MHNQSEIVRKRTSKKEIHKRNLKRETGRTEAGSWIQRLAGAILYPHLL
jgi:hypothetical protein